MVEFSFCLIVAIILFLGLIRVFVWSGKDLADRRRAYEAVLTDQSFNSEEQIRPVFYFSTRTNAAIDSNIYGK